MRRALSVLTDATIAFAILEFFLWLAGVPGPYDYWRM